MDAKPVRSAESPGPRSITYIVRQQDRVLPHRPLQRVWARFQATNFVVVLAGLAVVITAVVNIVLILLTGAVLIWNNVLFLDLQR